MLKDTISTVHKKKEQISEIASLARIVFNMRNVRWIIYKNNIKSVYGIPRGGVIPATIISYRQDIPLILNESDIDENTLIVDDIEDSGKTLKEFKKKFPNNKIFVLFSKKGLKGDANFIGEISDNDNWLEFFWERL